MKRLVCAMACILAAGASWAREPSRAHDQWDRADVNGDGRLSRAEAASMPRVLRNFEAIDRDRDGSVTADEVRAWRARAKKRRASKTSALAQVFSRADADGNGELDRREATQHLPRIAGQFDHIDADRSGSISLPELERWIAARTAR
jgi:Ca2+-binding EF-hand superfamily protein